MERKLLSFTNIMDTTTDSSMTKDHLLVIIVCKTILVENFRVFCSLIYVEDYRYVLHEIIRIN